MFRCYITHLTVKKDLSAFLASFFYDFDVYIYSSAYNDFMMSIPKDSSLAVIRAKFVELCASLLTWYHFFLYGRL